MAKLGILLSKYQLRLVSGDNATVVTKTVHYVCTLETVCLFEPGISGDKIGDHCILNLKPHIVVFTERAGPVINSHQYSLAIFFQNI